MCTMVAASYVTAASQSAGAAAEGTAARKCLKYAELSAAYEFQPVAVETSVRPSTPFSADTDTPIFCCQPMPIPMRYRYASRADVAQRD